MIGDARRCQPGPVNSDDAEAFRGAGSFGIYPKPIEPPDYASTTPRCAKQQ
jgi:hypothetical protein